MRKRASGDNSDERSTKKVEGRREREVGEGKLPRERDKRSPKEGGKDSGEDPTEKGRDHARKGAGARKAPTKKLIENVRPENRPDKEKFPVLEVHISKNR